MVYSSVFHDIFHPSTFLAEIISQKFNNCLCTQQKLTLRTFILGHILLLYTVCPKMFVYFSPVWRDRGSVHRVQLPLRSRDYLLSLPSAVHEEIIIYTAIIGMDQICRPYVYPVFGWLSLRDETDIKLEGY